MAQQEAVYPQLVVEKLKKSYVSKRGILHKKQQKKQNPAKISLILPDFTLLFAYRPFAARHQSSYLTMSSMVSGRLSSSVSATQYG